MKRAWRWLMLALTPHVTRADLDEHWLGYYGNPCDVDGCNPACPWLRRLRRYQTPAYVLPIAKVRR